MQTDNYTIWQFKRDDFDIGIVNFPFLCSNIPLSPAYGVCIYQLIRYARACFALAVELQPYGRKNLDGIQSKFVLQ
jgi:hypothetical protein